MSDFNIRSDSVDVEQVMEQIRSRIREKRGVDYTEQQLRELAAVKLEKFLDPRGVRSDLLQRFKERQPQYEKPLLPLYRFEDTTIYETHRGPLQWIRKMLQPLLKLLFNPNPIIHAFHAQAEINALNLVREEAQVKRRMEMESLYYEIIHNLVFELTRSGIEVKNLKMRVESLASRLEFNERRARALESAVVYQSAYQNASDESAEPTSREPRQDVVQTAPPLPTPVIQQPGLSPAPLQPAPIGSSPAEGPGQRSRRRRRRRGRRSGPPATTLMGTAAEGEMEDSAAGELEPAEETATAASSGTDTPSDDGGHSTGSGRDPDQQ
jgi:hypothetical protein